MLATDKGGGRDRDAADGLKRFKGHSVCLLSAGESGGLIDRLSPDETPQVYIGIV